MLRRFAPGALLLSLAFYGTAVAQQQDSTHRPSQAGDTVRRAGTKPDLQLVAGRTINLDTDEGTWISLDVSPDGRNVVFDLLGDLYLMPITGGTATSLTSGMAFDAQPRFSPDGRSVVFTSDRDGGDNVWTIDISTRETKLITKGKTSRYRSPEWAPDGKYIVVSRAAAAIGPSKLYMYHKDGGGGFQLIRDPQPLPAGAFPLTTLGAAFGKDDRYIWYAQRAASWEYNAGLPQFQLMTLDRRTGRRETRAALYGAAFRPALSPDGKYLVYGSRYEAQTGLRIRDLETADEKWLAYPVQRDEQESVASLDVLPGYSFTPDSKAVVVSYGGKIWRVPVDGSPATNIPFRVQAKIDVGPKLAFSYPIADSTDFVVHQIRSAEPSPDEKRLVFVAMDRLYVMDYPGGTPKRLTDLEGNEADPAWSPDGQWISFVTWTREGGRLYKVRSTGGKPTQLIAASAMYSQPVWSPDGNRIVVVRSPAQTVREQGGFQGAAEIVWVPAAGGTPTLILPTQGRGAPHFVPSDTGRIYLYSGGEGLVSIRWDGTDPRVHLKVTGLRTPEAPQPTNAQWAKMAPAGDQALVQVSNDLYLVTVPLIGETPTINLASLEAAEVPVKKITDVGGQFAAWSANGRRVHFSIGRSHFVYDVDRAKQVDDSVAAAQRARGADTTARRDSTQRPAGGPAANPHGYQPVETKIILRAKRDLPQATALLRGARIISMKGNEVIERGDILVRNNRIAAIGPTGTLQAPSDARIIDVAGKTIVPGFVDTHAHPDVTRGEHQQPWSYLVNLAYGVTTMRDPQTGTTDVLTYEDAVDAGLAVGPRIYSTGPGLFGPTYFPALGDDIKDLDHARRIMRRYSEFYDTKTLKMYITGNRQQRQWVLMAAREQKIMPTTEGALDFRYDMTMALDGYPGQEHALPITPLYKDVVTLYGQSGIAYTPTLLVVYGGPWGENYWYEHEQVYTDQKLRYFTPYEELAAKSRRRVRGTFGGGNSGGWFMDDEYNFPNVAKGTADIVKAGGKIGVGSHGQLNGLGYHWEMWSIAKGGMAPHDVLRCATIFGAEAIGLLGDLGSIEVGKLADLVVLDGNPLQDIRNTNTVRFVMKNGRMYDGNTLDEIYPTARKTERVLGTPARPNVSAGTPMP